jgi:hypothetical protein
MPMKAALSAIRGRNMGAHPTDATLDRGAGEDASRHLVSISPFFIVKRR